MSWQFSLLLVPIFAAFLLSAGLCAFTWRYRRKRAALWAMCFIGGVAGWTAVYSLQVMALDPDLKALFNNVRYPLVSLTVTGWFFFTLAYCDREHWIRPWTLAAVFAIPVITQVVIWTGLLPFEVRAGVDLTHESGLVLLDIDFGTWFWVHAVHAYIMTIGGIVIFTKFVIDTKAIPLHEGLVIPGAILLSFMAALVQDAGLTTLDYTPVLLSLTMVALWYVIYGKELLELMPVARKTVVEEIRDGIIVLDDDQRVIDFNSAATGIFQAKEGGATLDGGVAHVQTHTAERPDTQSVVGKTIEEITPLKLSERGEPNRREMVVQVDGETRHLTVTVTAIEGGRRRSGGWIVVLQDVTPIKQREHELELLNRVVRHDIQNDMMVVRGYASTAHERLPTANGDGADGTGTAVDEQTAVSGDDELLEILEDVDSYLELVVNSSDHVIELTQTVRGLLDAITSGERLALEPIDIEAVLDTELKKARANHEDAEFELASVELGPDVHIQANNIISSVFTNLFNNAVRHNDQETPKITVTVEEGEETVCVTVADNGPGVPDDQKTEVFGRGEKGLESPGTGVGLYLVDTLMDRFGGAVTIEDNEPRGAMFLLEFQKDG